MSDSSTQINSKSIDKSSKKSYINWKQPNCGGISIHGEETCFVTIKDSNKSECKCVNPSDFDCTLYFKLGFSAQKHKPYLKADSLELSGVKKSVRSILISFLELTRKL